jgi:hypothetical protein
MLRACSYVRGERAELGATTWTACKKLMMKTSLETKRQSSREAKAVQQAGGRPYRYVRSNDNGGLSPRKQGQGGGVLGQSKVAADALQIHPVTGHLHPRAGASSVAKKEESELQQDRHDTYKSIPAAMIGTPGLTTKH